MSVKMKGVMTDGNDMSLCFIIPDGQRSAWTPKPRGFDGTEDVRKCRLNKTSLEPIISQSLSPSCVTVI